jgi:hypothetical protein
MTMRVPRFLIAGALLLGALVFAPAAPASASSSFCANTCAGSATFDSYGEHLSVYDNANDQLAVVVWNYRYDYGAWYSAWNTNGPWTVRPFNLSIPEGMQFTYKVCLGSGGVTYWNTCGPLVYDRA